MKKIIKNFDDFKIINFYVGYVIIGNCKFNVDTHIDFIDI